MTELEISGVFTSFIGICLETQRHILCWPINIIASGLYLTLFARQRLFADAALQAIFIMLSIYGWCQWRHRVSHFVARPVKRRDAISIFVGVALIGGVVGIVLSRYTQDPAPYLDAILSSLSILATIWMAQRRREAWLVWIFANAAYVALFLSRNLAATALLYFVFLCLAVWGWYRWTFVNTDNSEIL